MGQRSSIYSVFHRRHHHSLIERLSGCFLWRLGLLHPMLHERYKRWSHRIASINTFAILYRLGRGSRTSIFYNIRIRDV